MTLQNKIFYNEASSAKLGWTPEWFGAEEFDDGLIKKIKKFQADYELIIDGLCGENTFRRIYTLREAQMAAFCRSNKEVNESAQKYIICNGKSVIIEWNKVVTMEQENNLKIIKGYRHVEDKRNISQFVVHWDAALSAKSCRDILIKRGLSVQFMIDNDGTIYQAVDCNHICWHAAPVNNVSIGVEISNAVYTKYQNHYIKEGFGPRPLIKKTEVHSGMYGPMLGFYDVQIDALKALIKAVHNYYGVPLEVPKDVSGKMFNTVHKKTDKELQAFKGVVAHYHISKNKYDPICLDIDEVVSSIK
jgi:hypothetical protein